jgi:predicted NUDIX family phosphoesterase
LARSRLLILLEEVLRERGVPLSARALVAEIQARNPEDLKGRTPWKTVGARLAVDIRQNPASPFIRQGRGLYGLREWPDAAEVAVPPRRISPLDEDILAVPAARFLSMLGDETAPGIFKLDYLDVVTASQTVPRRRAEETESFVQIIPSFVIFRGKEVLCYKRTRKTPENRLHDTRSIVFGGHLQSVDVPTLFTDERPFVVDFLFRELREELSLTPEPERYLYLGALYLTGSAFERQHTGLIFVVEAAEQASAKSLEPGYHSGLKFMGWEEVLSSSVMEDRWSRVCIEALGQTS